MSGSAAARSSSPGIGLFLDRGDDDLEAVGARGVQQEEGEAAVAGDEAEFLLWNHAEG